VLNWRERILYKLFRPRPPRPADKEASAAEIAAIIVEFIRLVDRQNGIFGKNGVVSFLQHHPEGRAGVSIAAGKLRGYFEPQVPPLAPDFKFDFSEIYDGTIEFAVLGDYRYEGFLLSGNLTPAADLDPSKSWPTPRLAVSAVPGLRSPVTHHAKRLRDVFVSDYGANDYRTTFGR
jgi:hypothetical protein